MCVCVSDVSGNEWRTRYETQIELNEQLERQTSLIHGRLEDLRGNPVGEWASVWLSSNQQTEITLYKRGKLCAKQPAAIYTVYRCIFDRDTGECLIVNWCKSCL